MADICYFVCPYRTPISGYCGSTGGYATCPHRKMDEPLTIKSAEPMTNADKYFRNATDEEIAEIVVEDWCELLNCNCQMEHSLYRTCDGMCKERVLNWLKKEAESNDRT